MTLGNAIRKARRSKDILQKDFCVNLGVFPSYLSEIENGRIPSVKFLIKIASQLDMTLSELLFEALETTDAEKKVFQKSKKMIDKMLLKLINE